MSYNIPNHDMQLDYHRLRQEELDARVDFDGDPEPGWEDVDDVEDDDE